MLCRRDAEFYRKRNSTDIAPTLPTGVSEQQSANAFSIQLSFACFIFIICVFNVLRVQRYNFFSDILAEQSFPRISEEKRLFFKKIATQNTSTEQ